jgi:hypothetical protein
MNPAKSPLTLVFAFTLALAGGMQAQNPSPSPPIPFPELPQASPACTTIQRVGLTEVKIVYSRPSMKHHHHFRGHRSLQRSLAHRGQRLHQDHFQHSGQIGGADGVEVPAGTYGLYTIPDEKAWTSS